MAVAAKVAGGKAKSKAQVHVCNSLHEGLRLGDLFRVAKGKVGEGSVAEEG